MHVLEDPCSQRAYVGINGDWLQAETVLAPYTLVSCSGLMLWSHGLDPSHKRSALVGGASPTEEPH
jgi:hypothetical protein